MRRWLWITFAYDKLHWPGNLAQHIWIKTRGYPLPRWLQPRFGVQGTREHKEGLDLVRSSYHWTPIGQRLEARRLKADNFFHVTLTTARRP